MILRNSGGSARQRGEPDRQKSTNKGVDGPGFAKYPLTNGWGL